jgi:hypothetical protein
MVLHCISKLILLICDKFNLEAVTVNQVKSFKALADEKDVFIGTKTGSGIGPESQPLASEDGLTTNGGKIYEIAHLAFNNNHSLKIFRIFLLH